MMRLTLVSDPTKEFPANTSSEFKVRLAQPLNLPGEGWQVALVSLSTPDAAPDLSRLTDGSTLRLFKLAYREGAIPAYGRNWYITAENLQAFRTIYDGVNMLKMVFFQFQKMAHLVNQDNNRALQLKYMPEFVWQGEDLEVKPKKLSDINYGGTRYIRFEIDKEVCSKMDWLRYNSSSKKYELGGNLSPRLPWDEQTQSYTPVSNTELDRHDTWELSENRLKLSMAMGWLFTNVNIAFRNVVGDPSRTFLVYSDVVDSNQVGAQLHPLLREVEYRQQGKGVAYFEPTHIQWMPCRREYLDIVEVSVGESHGGLVKFGSGRTIVTLMFKRGV